MVNGIWCEDPITLKQTFFDYYKNIFSELTANRPPFSNVHIQTLSKMEANSLEVAFSEEEVWGAVKLCGNSKAPGPDGFNFNFIKLFWGTIKDDLMKAINWFHSLSSISKGCNPSFVTLIPKCSDPIGLRDYRPISLIGCYYKIIAKFLAERCKRIIGKVIGDAQNAFIKGRYILDGVLNANETVDFIKKNRRKCLSFKADFEKVFDSVN